MAKSRERIGPMRHRVKLMKPTFTTDDYGEPVATTWTEYAERWARWEFRELRSDEREDVNRLTTQVYARVQMRYDNQVTAEWRAIFDGKEYDILTVLPDEKREYMLVECEYDSQEKTN